MLLILILLLLLLIDCKTIYCTWFFIEFLAYDLPGIGICGMADESLNSTFSCTHSHWRQIASHELAAVRWARLLRKIQLVTTFKRQAGNEMWKPNKKKLTSYIDPTTALSSSVSDTCLFRFRSCWTQNLLTLISEHRWIPICCSLIEISTCVMPVSNTFLIKSAYGSSAATVSIRNYSGFAKLRQTSNCNTRRRQ